MDCVCVWMSGMVSCTHFIVCGAHKKKQQQHREKTHNRSTELRMPNCIIVIIYVSDFIISICIFFSLLRSFVRTLFCCCSIFLYLGLIPPFPKCIHLWFWRVCLCLMSMCCVIELIALHKVPATLMNGCGLLLLLIPPFVLFMFIFFFFSFCFDFASLCYLSAYFRRRTEYTIHTLNYIYSHINVYACLSHWDTTLYINGNPITKRIVHPFTYFHIFFYFFFCILLCLSLSALNFIHSRSWNCSFEYSYACASFFFAFKIKIERIKMSCVVYTTFTLFYILNWNSIFS